MLYERWLKIAQERRQELALRDIASGRNWTFGELESMGESFPLAEAMAFPRGHVPEFIFAVLAAWRLGKPVCPLDVGQSFATEVPQEQLRSLSSVHLKMTSATTGPSRLILFTAEQLMADVDNIVMTMGMRPEWPNLGIVSMAHSYGFSNLVLPLLLCGIPLILVPVPLPEAVRQATENEKAVTIAGVPAMWRAWHEADAISAKVRLAISAGAPLPLETELAVFQKCGVKVHNFYGSSECGGIAYDASDEPRTDASCVGTPMKNVDLSVGSEGCLVVRSAAVGTTYWPEESTALDGGIFKTSDLVEMKDGRVFLRGRASDLINVAGRKVSPDSIEAALRRHPGVRDCVVFGVPSADQERGEVIVAVVVAKAQESELKQFLLETLPAWHVPRAWRFVESLATTARGKVSRALWRREWKG